MFFLVTKKCGSRYTPLFATTVPPSETACSPRRNVAKGRASVPLPELSLPSGEIQATLVVGTG